MITVGAFEAKMWLASLLDQVAAGEQVTITKHGTPVARLVPALPTGPDRTREAIARLRTFRKGQTLAPLRPKDLIAEGWR